MTVMDKRFVPIGLAEALGYVFVDFRHSPFHYHLPRPFSQTPVHLKHRSLLIQFAPDRHLQKGTTRTDMGQWIGGGDGGAGGGVGVLRVRLNSLNIAVPSFPRYKKTVRLTGFTISATKRQITGRGTVIPGIIPQNNKEGRSPLRLRP